MSILTAEEARKASSDINTARRQNLLKKISEAITKATEEGDSAVYVGGFKDDVVMEHLRKLGYQVEHHSNQRDGDDYYIKW